MRFNFFKKRTVIFIFIALLVCGCVSSNKKIYRIGMFSGFGNTTIFEYLVAEMSELGYVEGDNVEYVIRITDQVDEEEYRKKINEILNEEVDLLVSYPTDASLISKQLAKEKGIPVLFIFASTEDNGLVESLREPGENITGVRYPGPELVSQGLKKIVEISPEIQKALVAYLEGYPSTPSQINSLKITANELNITLTELPVDSPKEFEEWVEKYEEREDKFVDLFVFIAGPLASQINEKAIGFSKKYNIPAIGRVSENESLSGVLTYGSDTQEYSELAAPIIDKILNGIPAGKIPVVTPTIYLSINYNVAENLGLNISDGILSQAKTLIR
ncbi:MAG: hypothetical protein JW700_03655 [Candidatus Aenigmarchaeota archaeon]|nr:hypothetical protein [Candidatus Aenigmarchaeota archaeon]